jgi:hypothetical protein
MCGRNSLSLAAGMCLLALAAAAQTASSWPPRYPAVTSEPMRIPWLESPAGPIRIDTGRQLFVDDYLIESTDLKRVYHQAEYLPGNPVLKPDRPWEKTPAGPTAMPFSDGVWYDPADRIFKMWYMSGYVSDIAYAVSRDGIHWEKPALDVRPGTNVVFTGCRDSTTVWLDLEEKDPARRYKLFLVRRSPWTMDYFASPDGIHWTKAGEGPPKIGDRSTVFWNPFRHAWVFSIRAGSKLGRIREYREETGPLGPVLWRPGEPMPWVGADRLDPPREDLKIRSELYNLDGVAYESLILGLFSIWRGQPKDRPKPNDLLAGFSRDGFHWYRPDRKPLVPVSEHYGDWNWGNIQSSGGGCLVVKDKLYFYVSGRAGVPGSSDSGVCSTGLATLRRDGFASMDAGTGEGTLVTRPVVFRGSRLFVNADAKSGAVRAEVLDESGKPVEGFTLARSRAVRSDSTLAEVGWRGSGTLASLAGKPVRFRFRLRNARLYSFWVSPDASGASHGFVAAGGPGFTGPTDTVGRASYR